MNSTMFNAGDILETIRMIQDECLDIRTTTMGISLLDCIDPDINKACDKVYDKITRKAEKLVETGEKIEKEYGIPIINKRIAVTPIAMLAAACPKENPEFFCGFCLIRHQLIHFSCHIVVGVDQVTDLIVVDRTFHRT